MSIFDAISLWAKTLVGADKSASDLTYQAESVRKVLESLHGTLATPDYLKAFIAGLDIDHPNAKPRYMSGSVYRNFVAGLSLAATHAEEASPMSTVIRTLDVAILDISALLRNRKLLEIKHGEERVSYLITAGYIQALGEFANWLYSLLRLSDQWRPDGSEFHNTIVKTPSPFFRYTLSRLTPKVSALVSEIGGRKPRQGFVEALRALEKSGHDLSLASGEHSIADYANERNYTESELTYAQAGLTNIFLNRGVDNLLHRREWIARNEAIRDWLAAKSARFALDSANTDPDTPEYQRLLRISQNYADKVGEYDKKLEDYANKH